MGCHLNEVTRPRIWVIGVIFIEIFDQGKANLVWVTREFKLSEFELTVVSKNDWKVGWNPREMGLILS